MSDQWDESYAALLRDTLPRLAQQGELPPDTSLKAAGLDSLTMVEVLIRVEGEYGISIPDDELVPGVFDTPAALWGVVARLRGVQHAAGR
ncbi:acyl carrier protein [Streptomyces sp. A5-4]|uniref:acyl carrier protein n=1 Tax=Streptomyces sp. A5-4 TaxID=3384771 RepID=UPI003DA8D1FA